MSDPAFDRPCGQCSGCGRLPLPDTPAAVLDVCMVLNRAAKSITAPSVYELMAAEWRAEHVQGVVNNALRDLARWGILRRGSRGRVVKWFLATVG